MAVKTGYKQTEIGVIPEDWKHNTLQNISSFITKGATPTTYGFSWQSDGVLFLRSECVSLRGLDISQSMFISDEAHNAIRRSEVRANDILITITGNVGRVILLSDGFVKANINQHIARIRVISAELDTNYLYHQLTRVAYQKYFNSITTGQAYPQISLKQVREAVVFYPPIHEQQAIAAALSDVDQLIASLDQLIEKRRALKTAAMQQLLTGKTRLAGFSGEWITKPLGDLGVISGAGIDKKNNSNEDPVRLLNYMDVYRNTFIKSSMISHMTTAKTDKIKHCSVKRGDIFFTPTSETRDDIGRSAVALETINDAVYSYHLVRLRLNEEWSTKFSAYAFQSRRFLDQASMQCEGSGTRYVITLPKFRSITIEFPSDKLEQAAIGEVLSDMDAEITELEQRRDKTQAIKQGMMQELLTGRTRLL